MRTIFRFFAATWLLVGSSFLGHTLVADQAKSKPAAPTIGPVYSVDSYDPKRNPEEDLQMTVKRAKSEGKRILLRVGGDWCSWCKLLSKYFHQNKKVATALAKDYLIMKVDFSSGKNNRKFLAKYPAIPGYPHLYVLDSNGKLLHSQGTAALEEGRGYNEKKVLDFLAKWVPKKAG